MSQRDTAIQCIRHSLNQVRYRPRGDDSHMTGIHYGIAIGEIAMAKTAGLISLTEGSLLSELALNAANWAAVDRRRREASHG